MRRVKSFRSSNFFQTKQTHLSIIEELLKSKSELDNLKQNLSLASENVRPTPEQAAKSNLRLKLTKSKCPISGGDRIKLR